MLVSVMIMGYCNSRRKKYLPVNSRDYGTHFLTAEKNRLDKSGKFMHIFTYRLALGFGNGSAGGKTGSILKDPDQWNIDYDPKAYKKAWVDLTPFETYLLFDLAEKYVDEDRFYYPEYKMQIFSKKAIISSKMKCNYRERENISIKSVQNRMKPRLFIK